MGSNTPPQGMNVGFDHCTRHSEIHSDMSKILYSIRGSMWVITKNDCCIESQIPRIHWPMHHHLILLSSEQEALFTTLPTNSFLSSAIHGRLHVLEMGWAYILHIPAVSPRPSVQLIGSSSSSHPTVSSIHRSSGLFAFYIGAASDGL